MTDDDVPVILEDLTAQQVEMLNKIWSFENAEQLQRFRDTLPIFRKQELDTLVQLIIMEIEGVRAEADQSLAQEMLKNIGLNV
jgi:hypothetical protein